MYQLILFERISKLINNLPKALNGFWPNIEFVRIVKVQLKVLCL